LRSGAPVSDRGPELICSGLQKSFPASGRGGSGTPTPVLADLTFKAESGQFVTIVGPSGCGKTTLLRCLAGLLPPDSGSVTVGGRPVTGVPDGLAIVPQDYNRSLFPWLTLERNVAFGLDSRAGKKEARRRANAMLDRVGLGEHARHYPWQVSGGMQQRTAIARALAQEARLVIFDEPFASVDALTRMQLEDFLLGLWTEFGFTAVFVTHDVDEAVYLGDKVVVLSGRPAAVDQEIPVPLPRPRDEVATREAEEFQIARREALERLGVHGR
jgi:NitT/TauT family transport system ATP-binding protein